MLQAGIIGAGRIAWAYDGGEWDGVKSVSHAACLNRHPDTRLVSIFDPNPDSYQAFKAGYRGNGPVQWHTDLAEFFTQNLDLVVIASPTQYHAQHLQACFQAQTPYVLLEKPAVLSHADFKKILHIHTSGAANTQITVNYFRRFLPQVAKLKAYVQNALQQKTLARIDVSYSRSLQVNGVHQLDLLAHLFDATDAPGLTWCDQTFPDDPSFWFLLGGCPVAVLGLPDLGYHGLDLRITTQDGQMSLTRNGGDLLYAQKIPNPDYPGFYHLAPPQHVIPISQTHHAMKDGTYLALCDLIAGTNLSPLDQSNFAQVLLDQAMAGQI